MEKKSVRILWNVFGTLAALVLPTMINVASYMVPRDPLYGWLFLLLEILLLILLVIFSSLVMRKSRHFPLVPLYTSVVGCLIFARMTPVVLPIVLPLFHKKNFYGKNFGGANFATALNELLIAIPLACVALLAAILLTCIYRKKKQAGMPVFGSQELVFSVDP